MKIETINNIRVAVPESGMFLCNENDRVISDSDKVYLGVNADETLWKEITETEKADLETLWNVENSHATLDEGLEVDYNE